VTLLKHNPSQRCDAQRWLRELRLCKKKGKVDAKILSRREAKAQVKHDLYFEQAEEICKECLEEIQPGKLQDIKTSILTCLSSRYLLRPVMEQL
jgi:hypothetical protein